MPARRHLVEQGLGRLAGDDLVGDAVGVTLVAVALGADAAGELDAAGLLDDVGGLVRGGVQIGRLGERDVRAGREGARADGGAGVRRRAADVRPDPGHVVAAERRLDPVAVGQGLGRTGDPVSGRGVDRRRVGAGRRGRAGRRVLAEQVQRERILGGSAAPGAAGLSLHRLGQVAVGDRRRRRDRLPLHAWLDPRGERDLAGRRRARPLAVHAVRLGLVPAEAAAPVQRHQPTPPRSVAGTRAPCGCAWPGWTMPAIMSGCIEATPAPLRVCLQNPVTTRICFEIRDRRRSRSRRRNDLPAHHLAGYAPRGRGCDPRGPANRKRTSAGGKGRGLEPPRCYPEPALDGTLIVVVAAAMIR